MRVKLGILFVGLIFVFSLLTNMYIIGNLEDDAKEKLEQTLIHSYSAYTKSLRVNREGRLDQVRGFAKEPEIIERILADAETVEQAEERHFKLFEKLEVNSRLKYYGDIFIVTDEEGMELARTQVASWKKVRYGDYEVVKSALKGKDGEDVWMLNGKIMIVDVTPIKYDGRVIGVMIMGNTIDEDLVKIDQEIAFGDFAYFAKDRVIASSLTSGKQAALNRFVRENGSKIATVLTSKNDYFEKRVNLEGDDYIVILAPIQTVQEYNLAGFMILRSESHWLRAYDGSRNFLMLLSVLLIIMGISVSILIVQKAYDAIDFILEGAHQIIVGNKDYQFNSDDEYLNGLGQTFNLMIAILLGKYIPEDEDDVVPMRGSLDGGPAARPTQSNMIIETMDNNGDAEEAVAADIAVDDSYYEKLFNDFIKAKKSLGDDISQITQSRMIAKLKRTESKLIEKHGCERVMFEVKVEKGKVTLKPSPIWK